MESPGEAGSVDSPQPKEIELSGTIEIGSNSITESNVNPDVIDTDTKGEENIVSIEMRSDPKEVEQNVNTESFCNDTKSPSFDIGLKMVACNENNDEHENVEKAIPMFAMDIEPLGDSNLSDQSCLNANSFKISPSEELSDNCSEKLSHGMSTEALNDCQVMILKNSALNADSADDVSTSSSSSTEQAEAQACEQISVEKSNVSTSEDVTETKPTILCNSNAFNALWDYGVLISSDESADEDDQLSQGAMQNFTEKRPSVVSLDSDSSLSHSSTSLFFSDDSESDDEHFTVEKNVTNRNYRPKKPLMTDGELALDDLPPIEDLHLTVPEHDCTKVGEIFNIVDKLVIVQGIKDMPPLDLESVLFLAWDRPLGLVFDVFGPVVEPLYCIRFNSNEEIKEKKILPGMPVFYSPKSQYTNYVFLKHLLTVKGSDASWADNNEPPPEQLDFSDDEAERAAKHALKAIKKELATDPDEPQRKKHMAYEQRMNAMNLFMNRVSELKQQNQSQQRKRRTPRKEGNGRLIRPSILSSAASTSSPQTPASPSPFHSPSLPNTGSFGVRPFQPTGLPTFQGAVAMPFAQPPPPCSPFPACPVNFSRFVPPPETSTFRSLHPMMSGHQEAAALQKNSVFVDTSVPPPAPVVPQSALFKSMAVPPPDIHRATMSMPPPTPTPQALSPFFCNVNLPPPHPPHTTNRLFRTNNSVNLNSLFPDLFMNYTDSRTPSMPGNVLVQQSPTRPLSNASSYSYPPPPPNLHPTVPAPGAVSQQVKDNVGQSNRLPIFNQATFHNPLHRPATPTPPTYMF